MAFTKNYYTILNLSALSPTARGTPPIVLSPGALKSHYRGALLAAHPDKILTADSNLRSWSVDDVKEAYAVLGDQDRKREFDEWVLRTGEGGASGKESSQDFVLGLEVLDLEDFAMVVERRDDGSGGSDEEERDANEDGSEDGDGDMDSGGDDDGVGSPTPRHKHSTATEEAFQMVWIRPCRCGDEAGFSITERELEHVSQKGEKEVLVGCEGCSLWARVAFDVELDEADE